MPEAFAKANLPTLGEHEEAVRSAGWKNKESKKNWKSFCPDSLRPNKPTFNQECATVDLEPESMCLSIYSSKKQLEKTWTSFMTVLFDVMDVQSPLDARRFLP